MVRASSRYPIYLYTLNSTISKYEGKQGSNVTMPSDRGFSFFLDFPSTEQLVKVAVDKGFRMDTDKLKRLKNQGICIYRKTLPPLHNSYKLLERLAREEHSVNKR